MNQNHLDALLIPISTNGSPTYDALTVNTWRAPVSSNAGLPSLAMNIGYNPKDNMPIGIELVGKKFAEGTLIEIAYAYEKHSPPRRIPRLPEPNTTIENFSIPELNNLFTVLGKNAYENILKDAKPGAALSDKLTPEIFSNIVANQVNKLQQMRSKTVIDERRK